MLYTMPNIPLIYVNALIGEDSLFQLIDHENIIINFGYQLWLINV